jgi:hypothetical protein
MGGDIPPEVFQAYLEQRRAEEARQGRMTVRKVLAEMVRQELAERRLTWRRRRALVRYAVRLGLDAPEAQMLVRAAECGFGGGPASDDSGLTREYLADVDRRHSPSLMLRILFVALILSGMGLVWLWGRGN